MTEIDQIPSINLATTELQDNIVTAQCLVVDIKSTTFCICCNKTIEDAWVVDDTATCPNCDMKDVVQ